MEQQYAVPSELGTTYIVTENPPVGATLVQGDQSPSSNTKASLEQRIEVLEKAVSNINERLGIKTDSSSVNTDAASELLDSLDSSAATKATNELANSNGGASTAAASSASSAPSSSAAASVSSAAVPSAGDIAKQLGDLT